MIVQENILQKKYKILLYRLFGLDNALPSLVLCNQQAGMLDGTC